jgi:hypothetical protein
MKQLSLIFTFYDIGCGTNGDDDEDSNSGDDSVVDEVIVIIMTILMTMLIREEMSVSLNAIMKFKYFIK